MAWSGRWTEENIGDQRGKRAIVTGANSGIGFETARVLASKGAEVTMACRDSGRGEAAARRIVEAHPDSKVTVAELDLASLESVRRFVERFEREHDELHLLINNAGVMALPDRRETADGFELQFGTNHLGPFALTGRLLELLAATPGSRVVVVSSMVHRQGRIHFDDLQAERSYSPFRSYGQSKLANLLFTFELQRRLDAAGLETMAVAAHPGWTATNLQQHSGFFKTLNPLFAQKQIMGALPTLYAATVKEVKGGEFFGPRGIGEMRGYPKKVTAAARAHDADAAARLWEVSKELTGVEYETLSPREE